MITTEVLIVGGGPAGAAAAATLARAGHEVLLIDKATFPRDKFCGDGLTTGALRRLESLGLDPASVPSWRPIDDMVLRTPSGRETTFPLPRGSGQFAAVAKRAELDAAVLALARAAGTDIREGHACRSAVDQGESVMVDATGLGTIEARHVIAADGMWSPMRRFLGLASEGYRGDWHAFRQYFDDVGPRAREALYVSFEPDFLPGYFWSFPVGASSANVGFGIRRGGAFSVGAMKTLWPELLARPHIRDLLGPHATPHSPHRAWPIPARVNQMLLASGRTLFVGDAAATADPLTGEGIGQALATGEWAADAIIAAGGSDPASVRRAYERAVHDGLVADHRMASLLADAMSHRKGVRIAVRLAGTNGWTRRNFARWLFEDYPRALVATPRRWQSGMFTGPGAYRDR